MKISIKFVKEDMWIGVFYRKYPDYQYGRWQFWICIIPCVPIHIIFPWDKRVKL